MDDVHPSPAFVRAAGQAIEPPVKTRVRALVAAPLLLRLALAAVFFAHGCQKLFGLFGGDGLQKTAESFAQMGISPPMFLAVLAGLIEFLGSILLFIGLYTRTAATVLLLEMVFAMLAVHLRWGFFLNWSNAPDRGQGIEYHLVLLASLAALVCMGAGAASVHGMLQKKHRWTRVLP